MNNKDSVCAVVVTFNRRNLLLKCIDTIKVQSRPIDAIYIIDNASTDGTAKLLFAHSYIDFLPPVGIKYPWEKSSEIIYNNSRLLIHYVRIPQNTGGAGGFYEGQIRAYKKGYDWLWMMDDDGHSDSNCLKTLLKDASNTKLHLLNPLVINIDNSDLLSFGLAPNIITVQEAIEAANSDNIIISKANPFNGTLIHRKVIKKSGFIKKEMFIWGDEQEYMLRIKSDGFGFATSVGSFFFHPKSKTQIIKLFFGFVEVETKPKELEMNYYRNIGYIANKYQKMIGIRKLVIYSLYFLKLYGIKRLIMFYKYYLDGWYDRYNLSNFSK